MHWFQNQKTLAKLMLGFGLMAALMGVLGFVSIRNLRQLNAITRLMYEHHALGLNYIKEADTQLVTDAKALREALLVTNAEEREKYVEQFLAARDRSSAEFLEFEKLIELAATRAKADRVRRLYPLVNAAQDRVVAELRANRHDRALAELPAVRLVYGQLKALVDEMAASKLERLKTSAQEVDAKAQTSQSTTLAVVAVAVMLAIGLGLLIARIITRPLTGMVSVAEKLAAGDVNQKIDYRSGDEPGQLASAFSRLIETVKELTAETGTIVQSAQNGELSRRGDASKFSGAFRGLVEGLNATMDAFSAPVQEASKTLEQVSNRDLMAHMQGDYKGDFAAIKTSLNAAVQNISTALTEVKSSADHVADTSRALTAASEEISSGAQQQASSLEETAASLEEMTSTVKQNAENARQASQLASGSRVAAEKGGQVVRAAVLAMGEINEASKRIADIITTIDEIAFQTNLLALNAAVEAARAGEQGRGFAVVASEVRNLAQRSASAAKEIKGLIQDSVRKVENGSALVNQSGQTLDEIMQSVKRVTDIVAEIAAASQEQATGIDQVNKATIQMDQVTQANSAQTEEMSSTAQALNESAEQLQNMVGRFRLPGGPAPAQRAIPVVSNKSRHKAIARAPVESLIGLAKRTGTSDNIFEEF